MIKGLRVQNSYYCDCDNQSDLSWWSERQTCSQLNRRDIFRYTLQQKECVFVLHTPTTVHMCCTKADLQKERKSSEEEVVGKRVKRVGESFGIEWERERGMIEEEKSESSLQKYTELTNYI